MICTCTCYSTGYRGFDGQASISDLPGSSTISSQDKIEGIIEKAEKAIYYIY